MSAPPPLPPFGDKPPPIPSSPPRADGPLLPLSPEFPPSRSSQRPQHPLANAAGRLASRFDNQRTTLLLLGVIAACAVIGLIVFIHGQNAASDAQAKKMQAVEYWQDRVDKAKDMEQLRTSEWLNLSGTDVYMHTPHGVDVETAKKNAEDDVADAKRNYLEACRAANVMPSSYYSP